MNARIRTKLSIGWWLAVVLALLLAPLALADTVLYDSDVYHSGYQTETDLYARPGFPVSTNGSIVVSYAGAKHLKAGSLITFAKDITSLPAGYSIPDVSTTVPLSENWNSIGDSFNTPSSISFTAPGTPGYYEYNVTWKVSAYTCSTSGCLAKGMGPGLAINLIVDNTPPVITFLDRTPANEYGWNNNDVIVRWTCTDNTAEFESGVVASIVSQTVSDEGENLSSTGTCEDRAGNTASATVSGINIDKTAPTININTPSADQVFLLNEVVTANFTCEDNLSGIDSCAGTAIETNPVGNKEFTATAVDKAGNSASLTNPYTVAYRVCALYDQSKVHKSGSTIPIKLQLCDVNGVNFSSDSIVLNMKSVVKLDSATSGIVEDSGDANPDANFRYSPDLLGYIFNFSTDGLTSGTWKILFTVNGADIPAKYFVRFDIR